MAKDTYPSVKFSETDLTNVIRSQFSNIGGMVGRFQMGPVNRPVIVSDKTELIESFGLPVSTGTSIDNLQDWYNAANYLGYSSGLFVCRVEPVTSRNAGMNFTGSATAFASVSGGTSVYVPDGYDMDLYYATMSGTGYCGLNLVSKNPGTWGNDISVKFATEEDMRFDLTTSYWDKYYYDYTVALTLSSPLSGLTALGTSAQYVTNSASQTGFVTTVAGGGTSLVVAYNSGSFGSGVSINVGATYAAAGAVTTSAVGTPINYGYNTFSKLFDVQSGTNEIAVAVYYKNVLKETHIVSILPTAVNEYQQLKYVDDWMTANSGYISAYYNTTKSFNLAPQAATAVSLLGGTLADQSYVTAALGVNGADVFADKDNYPVSVLFDGGFAWSSTVQNELISVAEARKDCFVVTSVGSTMPTASETAAMNTATTGLVARRAALTSSTYAGFWGNFKWQKNVYTGKLFKCSLSGDIAGIISRNDILSAPWYAPAGYSRGGIQLVEKLGVNFSKTNQGLQHVKQINNVIYDQREGGYYLLSQKTAIGRPSAFSDINVRKLFIYVENAVLNSAKAFMWEFNDVITRSNFSAIVTNFLSTIKSGRGIYDFRVVCDDTNNTADIIDTNQMICDVYIKPARSIAWITARFTAVRTDASFDELAG